MWIREQMGTMCVHDLSFRLVCWSCVLECVVRFYTEILTSALAFYRHWRLLRGHFWSNFAPNDWKREKKTDWWQEILKICHFRPPSVLMGGSEMIICCHRELFNQSPRPSVRVQQVQKVAVPIKQLHDISAGWSVLCSRAQRRSLSVKCVTF